VTQTKGVKQVSLTETLLGPPSS